MVGCSSPDADTFYRHCWDYQHKSQYDVIRSELGLPYNWRDTLPSNEVAIVESLDNVELDYLGESKITLTGGGGCLGYSSYNLYVFQIGDLVLAKLEEGFDGQDVFFEVPMEKYNAFWEIYFKCKDALTKRSYGGTKGVTITGAYHFRLNLEFRGLSEVENRTLTLSMEGFENKQVEDLYLSLMNMVDEKFRIQPVDYDALQNLLDKTTKGTTSSSTLLGQRPFLKAESNSQAGHE
jgi:hypothetical protein